MAAALCLGLQLHGPLRLANAEPIVPTRDDEIIETLLPTSGQGGDRRLRQLLSQRPRDAELAIRVAKQDLQRARDAGDPRFAGLALSALGPWRAAADAPDEILLLQATLQQYLHDFDGSVAGLQVLLQRPSGARMAQAWLTLATVHRVQGRYAESDRACRGVSEAGADVFGDACLAENAALKGQVDEARRVFRTLLADRRLQPDSRSWLLTSLAELEERDGKGKSAETAYRAALQLVPDAYTAVAYADFLIAQGQACEVRPVLGNHVRTDAVLLRLAIAGLQCGSSAASRDAAEMKDRIDLANQRPDARIFHGREQAMFALFVEQSPALAVTLARDNAQRQREAIDVLVFAKAARASRDPALIEEVRRLKKSIGLYDRRIDALL